MRLPVLALLLVGPVAADDRDRMTVGVQPDGRVVVPTNQILHPAGQQVTFPGRPVDVALIDNGATLVVKGSRDLLFLDAATGAIRQTLSAGDTGGIRGGFSVVGLAATDDYVYASNAQDHLLVAKRQPGGPWAWSAAWKLNAPAVKGAAHPAGLSLLPDGTLAACATRANTLQFFRDGKVVNEIAVGVAPFAVVRVGDKLYVSNWGGDRPTAGEPQAVTSGTPIRIDAKTGIGNHGSVSVLSLDAGTWKVKKSIAAGLHSSGMAASPDGKRLYVANAAEDTVSVIDTITDTVVETIACRPESRLPFGSGSNAVAVSPDGDTLYVANGTNNCVAVVKLGTPSRVVGQIPTAWYPGAVATSADGKRLYVANIKGYGSLASTKAAEKGRNTHEHLGSVSLIDVPDAGELATWTRRVNDLNRTAYSLAGLEKPRPNVKPVPVPERHGEPSVFDHVIYVVKENRTYDQVLGDMPEGNGDPKLCVFGEEVTPNHHALAREFVLLDNFYCSGVLSADGHSWISEAYVTDYLERSFGGWTRSYPDDGTDPLAYPLQSGFIWDNALRHGKTLRNYGEFVKNVYPKGKKWRDFYADYTSGKFQLKVEVTANVPGLKPHTHPGFPWFPLHMPDVTRAKLFIDELKQFEAKGTLPNFLIVTLPCDHAEGLHPDFPTPRAMIADNDLALGQIVEAVSHSKFWPKTCILVVEDDPQAGYDHVDGHRTVAFAISPYTKRKSVDSTCYNQTGMVKTIELMLGLPPMNQLDLSATPMRNCFTDTPDVTPYKARPNRIPLDEMNKPLSQLSGSALKWAKLSLDLYLEQGDQDDEDTLNRILWFSVRGDQPYPGDAK